MLPTDPKARKEMPIARGVLDYFPDAIAAIANVSYVGNEQHNPGEEMHWARNKSSDHADCIARHLTERGTIDDDNLRHSAKLAWRALALLQLEIEANAGEAVSKVVTGVDDPQTGFFFDDVECLDVRQAVSVYIAGPMRGYPAFNFEAFDHARDSFLSHNFDVVSPADIDRELWGFCPLESPENLARAEAIVEAWTDEQLAHIIMRDVAAILSCDGIALLPGWEHSTGAVAEFFVARWAGKMVLDATTGEPFTGTPDVRAIMNSIIDYLED